MQAQSSLAIAKSPIGSSREVNTSQESQALEFKFSNYKVMHLIGSGANGKCFVAKKQDADEYIAIKRTKKDIGCYEVECLKQLNPHTNIVRLLGFQDTATSYYPYNIALELADCDLADMIGLFGIDSITLKPDQIAHIFKNIIAGYLYIREKDLIDYVDLDDSNTLYFSKDCHFKISDFNNKIKIDSDPERIRSLSYILYKIASKFSHKCKAIQSANQRAVCQPFCREANTSTPLLSKNNWQSVLTRRETEIILKMFELKTSFSELNEYILELEGRSSPFEKPPSLKPMRMI
ncbi:MULTISPECIES: protein kinase domain-containing protein [unclassified Endozoicomonas]|uniref:protein kinase domain-containing protein n=1 Tax=unclassified Endozoicomonas TaxID=2644528 RepID=UPI003BB59F0B